MLGLAHDLARPFLRSAEIERLEWSDINLVDRWITVGASKAKTASRGALEISDLQAVERDMAFVLDAQVEALNVINAAQGADKALIEEVRVFDEFVGGSLGAGKKSLAITVRMQPRDKTLTDEEIDAVGRAVVEKVAKATGGVLRG